MTESKGTGALFVSSKRDMTFIRIILQILKFFVCTRIFGITFSNGCMNRFSAI